MKEIWREHPYYNGIYLISNMGRVKSVDQIVPCKSGATRVHKGKELKQFKNERGYLCVVITKGKKSKIKKVHRLVAETFIDNPQCKPQVNHIDCNKQNNNVTNLEWCTNAENMFHASKNGLVSKNHFPIGGEFRKRRVCCIELHRVFDSIALAAKELKLHSANISFCCRNPDRKTGNYHFRYEKEYV